MHSSAKSRGLHGESRDEGRTLSEGAVKSAADTPRHKNRKHSCMKVVPPSPPGLIVLSVRMFLAAIHNRESPFREWVSHAQPIDLLAFGL